MTQNFHLLVADRNRHVRDFLSRELAAEGYRVMSAKDGREVRKILLGEERLDLIILDHELPLSGRELLCVIEKRIPPAPVILHSYLSESECAAFLNQATVYLEKSGDNLDRVKSVVEETLSRHYPERFLAVQSAKSPRAEERNNG